MHQVTIKQTFSSTGSGRQTTTFRTRGGDDVPQTTTFRTGRGADVPQTTTFRTRGRADVPQTSGRPEEELDISDDCPKQTSSNESAEILQATSRPIRDVSETDVRSSNKSSPGHLKETSSPTCDVGESADLQAIADSRIVEFFVKNKIPVQVIMFSEKNFFTFLPVFWIIIFY